ncbi:MAG TPA: hypothetical protein VJ302_17905 [Blastocatellia bacterium]|nr:hypothetical protein [Blastocatellia bacterium]
MELVQYLKINGWQQNQQIPDKAVYWLGKGITGEELEILLPLRPDFADYTARMAEVLHVLEVAEGRSQLEILHDLNTANADVVRIRTHMDEPDLNGIHLDEGVLLHKRARDLWVAAACATWYPKPAFANRKPDAILDYVRRVRFGLSEGSSYVLTIVSPVPPGLNFDEHLLSDYSQEPFERKIALTLAGALKSVRAAAQRSAATGNVEPFRDAVPYGVSANLCEALVGLSESGENSGVEISFAWALARQAPETAPKRVLLSADVVSYCSEAAKILRATSAIDDVEVQGEVTGLERSYEAVQGKITVSGLVDGRPRRIVLSLSPADYELANRANNEKLPIYCVGKLDKEGGTWVLRNPRDFAVMREMD